ncbi:MAG TPA: tail fiber domain-containing protein [Spirochaetota bacterium]|nr:tail fiber domain-containing protein [Spirochaetota bacterium]HRZ28190.1 tail fiber domain-containing protein [Spirochaetota bacterium]HSA16230.1 tail fiber domain-containing protein [Spirochaetota bacterium]
MNIVWSTGDIQVKGNVTAAGYSCSSDIRFKQNITPYTSALQKIMGLQGVTYDWNTEKFKDRTFSKDRQIGFIAQDVEKVIPEVVKTDDQGYKSMDYAKMSVVLVEAFKEQKRQSDAKISALEKENTGLKLRLASLEKMSDRVARLENMMKQQKAVLAAR